MENSILVVDDNHLNLNLLLDILNNAGYKVLAATTSDRAIDRATHQLPQLILLDILMPKMDGFEICQLLKSNPKTKDIPIIFITGLTETKDKLKGFKLGAADYITKPIKPQEVLARVASHLKIYQLQQQLQARNRQLEAQAAELEKSHHDLLSILNQFQVGSLITDADGHIIFRSEFCRIFDDFNQNPLHGKPWEDVLPLDRKSKEQLRLMMKEQAEQRTPVTLSWEDKAGQRYWLECDIRNDPRNPAQHFFYFYDQSEVYRLRQQLRQIHAGIIGESQAMQRMYDMLERMAKSHYSVMIEGETGVGKELVARSIHALSSRHKGLFIAINCGGLTESLLTSQLFGHSKGAFTGATENQTGFFEAAAGGTLFLDEIGELSLNMQSSLLRVLQENEITRVGETKARQINVRILTATHKNLEQEVREGRFREDLFYRIRVVRIQVPPLRERLEDIPLLVSAFLTEAWTEVGQVKPITVQAMNCLQTYHWPGNVRELKHAIEYGMVHSRQAIIRADDLPPEILRSDHQNAETRPEPPLDETLEFEGDNNSVIIQLDNTIRPFSEIEKDVIMKAIDHFNGDVVQAANKLNIGKTTVYKKLKQWKAEEKK
jgi:DNA-binding NtrC family response regulator